MQEPSEDIDRRAELMTHIAWLAAALDAAEPSAVAGLVRERRLTLAELAGLPEVSKESAGDQLRARREARRDADDPASTSRRSQQRRRGGSDRMG